MVRKKFARAFSRAGVTSVVLSTLVFALSGCGGGGGGDVAPAETSPEDDPTLSDPATGVLLSDPAAGAPGGADPDPAIN